MRSASLPAVQHLVWIGLRVVVVGGGRIASGYREHKTRFSWFLAGAKGYEHVQDKYMQMVWGQAGTEQDLRSTVLSTIEHAVYNIIL